MRNRIVFGILCLCVLSGCGKTDMSKYPTTTRSDDSDIVYSVPKESEDTAESKEQVTGEDTSEEPQVASEPEESTENVAEETENNPKDGSEASEDSVELPIGGLASVVLPSGYVVNGGVDAEGNSLDFGTDASETSFDGEMELINMSEGSNTLTVSVDQYPDYYLAYAEQWVDSYKNQYGDAVTVNSGEEDEYKWYEVYFTDGENVGYAYSMDLAIDNKCFTLGYYGSAMSMKECHDKYFGFFRRLQ